MLKIIQPRNARSKRALEHRQPKIVENEKTVLFLRGTSTSEVVQAALNDLHMLKKPHVVKFTKKNAVHPFEDASPLEFFSQKNDTSLIVMASHSKKRPHNLTFVRTFNHVVLDMMELLLDPETFRKLSDFKNQKCGIGMKPMLAFHGPIFDSNPTYNHLRSLMIDFFRGNTVNEIDVEALQYIITITCADPTDLLPQPKVHLRTYLLRTKKSGQKLPRVELEEMGPRMDFKIGRVQEPNDDMMKQALQKSKATEARTKKNIETDIMGDKLGRIHLGKQEINKMQTRKMKGLKKRGRSDEDGQEDAATLVGDEEEGGVSLVEARVKTAKKARRE